MAPTHSCAEVWPLPVCTPFRITPPDARAHSLHRYALTERDGDCSGATLFLEKVVGKPEQYASETALRDSLVVDRNTNGLGSAYALLIDALDESMADVSLRVLFNESAVEEHEGFDARSLAASLQDALYSETGGTPEIMCVL